MRKDKFKEVGSSCITGGHEYFSMIFIVKDTVKVKNSLKSGFWYFYRYYLVGALKVILIVMDLAQKINCQISEISLEPEIRES